MRLAVDTSAAVDFIRDARSAPPPLAIADEVFLPLTTIGELYAGARLSTRVDENVSRVDDLLSHWEILHPTLATAQIYGTLRAIDRHASIPPSKINDLWIAALCLQHGLPLLTNDRGFDSIEGLTVIHW